MLSPWTSLVGFKYIGNTALDLVKQSYNVPFGYEEAIGFMLDTGIRDKDGVAASVRTILSSLGSPHLSSDHHIFLPGILCRTCLVAGL